MFAIKSPFESVKVNPLALNKTSSKLAKVAFDMLSTPWFVVVTIKFEFVELSLLHILTGVVVVQVKAIIKSSAYTGPK